MLIVLTSLALAWVVFVLMPFGTFQLATEDFQSFGRMELLAYVAAASSLALAMGSLLLASVRKLLPRLFPFACAFVFSLAVMLYVQGNLIGLDYGLLDGQPIDWASMRVGGAINSAVWVVGLVGGTALFGSVIRRNREAAILTEFVFLGYLLILVSCCFVFSPKLVSRPARLNDGNLMELSSDRNLVVFILDSYDRGLFDYVLDRNPALRQDLAGFTYFHNTMGRFSATGMAVPQLVTGHIADPDEESDISYRNQCYADTPFLEEVVRQGFEVDLYTDPTVGPLVGEVRHLGCFGNADVSALSILSEQTFGMFRSLMRVSWFRYLPHAFKARYWDYLMRRGFSCANADGEDCSVRAERLLDENLALGKGFTIVPKRKVKIYHLNGVHTPKFTPEQALRSMDFVNRYRTAVEKAGLADCTSFIVLGDHGVLNRPHPIFLCSNGDKTFIEDNRPVSYRRMAEIWSSALTNRVVSVPAAKPEEMRVSSKDRTVFRKTFFESETTFFAGRLLELIRLSPNMDTTGNYEDERIVWDGTSGFLAIPIASSLRGHALEIAFVFETEQQAALWAESARVQLPGKDSGICGMQKGKAWTVPISVEAIDSSGVFVRLILPSWSSATPPPPVASISLTHA